MKRSSSGNLRQLLLVPLVLLVSLSTVRAQSPNLLKNPGFEQPFLVQGGNPPRQVADGWMPWHLGGGQSASEKAQPEYYPASDVTNGLGVPRIRTGADAQQYHTFFATHDGGLYQQVSGVTVNAQLRFSVYVYVWSSTFDDPNVSELDGGVAVRVGVDPSGGTDGSSASIVWSTPQVQYDAYNLYEVTAAARNSTVTVFVRSSVTTPVKSNNVYVDDASLVVMAGQPSTATPLPSTATTIPPTFTRVPPTFTLVPVVPSVTPIIPTATIIPTITMVPPTSVPASPSPTQEIIVPPTPVPQGPSATPPVVIPPSATPVTTSAPPSTPGVPDGYLGSVLHTVQQGDTVMKLAELYGSSIDAIIAANGLNINGFIRAGQVLVIPVRLPSPATSTPTNTPVGPVPTATSLPPVTPLPSPESVYVVRSGDSLSRIAARFGTSTLALAQRNGITNPNLIRVGQRLVIPGSGVIQPPSPTVVFVTATSAPPVRNYVVQPGDTLFRIALRFGVPVTAIIQSNSITNPDRLFVGQVLIIP